MSVILLEKDIRKEVREYLKKSGWYTFPIPAGYYSPPGLPDIVTIKSGIVLFIEFKSPIGKQSPDQKRVQEMINNHGGNYIVIHSLDEFIDFLFDKGIEQEKQENIFV